MSLPGTGAWAVVDCRGRLMQSWGRYAVYAERRAAQAAVASAPTMYGEALSPYRVQPLLLTRCCEEPRDDDTV